MNQVKINQVAKKHFRKSAFYKGKFINLASCQYFTIEKAMTLVSFDLEVLDMDLSKTDKVSSITMALNNLPKVNASDLENYHKNINLKFMQDYFEGKEGEKILGYEVFKAYQKEHGNITAKQFYTNVKCWAAEFGYFLNFINRLGMRKIIYVK